MSNTDSDGRLLQSVVLQAVRFLTRNKIMPITLTRIRHEVLMYPELGAVDRDIDRVLQSLRRSKVLRHVRKVDAKGKTRKLYGWMVA